MDEIEEIKKKALMDNIPIIMDDTLEEINKVLETIKPNKILEIGTAVGYSAICFSKYLSCGGKIDTIERDEDRAKEARDNIEKLGLGDKINVILGDAVEILPTLDQEYDMIFIDAAKSKYPTFLKEAIKLSHRETVIIADNILYKGYVMGNYNKHKQRTAVNRLREYIEESTTDRKMETMILEVGDGLAISKIL